MLRFFSENCIDKLATLGVGLGAMAVGGGAAIGAQQLVATGIIGFSAVAGAKALKDRIKDDAIARDVFERTVKAISQNLSAVNAADESALNHVSQQLDLFLEKIEFPIADIKKLMDLAYGGPTLPEALAQDMTRRLGERCPSLREPAHIGLTTEILTEAVRAGISASESLKSDVILGLVHRVLLDVREEGERTRAKVEEDGEKTRAMLTALAAQLAGDKVSKDEVEGFIRRLIENLTKAQVAPTDWPQQVSDQFALLEQEIARVAQASNYGADFDALMAQVRERLARLDFDGASEHLLRAIAADEAGIDDLNAQIAARRARKITTREEVIRVRLLAFDIVGAEAQTLALAADLGVGEGEALTDFLWDRGATACNVGSEQGDNAALMLAIALWRRVAERLDGEPRASAQNNLGGALAKLGEREAGTARLEEAVLAYREALKEWTQARVPLRWAMTQNNLGAVLTRLGEREAGTARLEASVAAYREALKERTQALVPLQWAGTQNNLGNALAILGGRETGIARLEEAAVAFREALKERSQARDPLDWAATQNNLGNALWALGEWEAGTARLEEAVLAYREALKERTQARVPLQWAMTQTNLGNALASLGERGAGTARLEEAVAAFRQALKERTQARVPLDWAATQNNLGTALQALGEREAGTARLEEAVAAFRAALKEWTRDRVPLQWATTQNNLGSALGSLGQREAGTARLDEAVAAYRAALTEWTRERVPRDWAATQNNLAKLEEAFGDKTQDPARYRAALQHGEAALAVFQQAGASHYVQMAEENLARVRGKLSALGV